MDEILRELNGVYNVSRETAALLLLCQRLDEVCEWLERIEDALRERG